MSFAFWNICARPWMLLRYAAASCIRSALYGFKSTTIQSSSLPISWEISVINTVFPHPRTPEIIYTCWGGFGDRKSSKICRSSAIRLIYSIGSFPNVNVYGFCMVFLHFPLNLLFLFTIFFYHYSMFLLLFTIYFYYFLLRCKKTESGIFIPS